MNKISDVTQAINLIVESYIDHSGTNSIKIASKNQIKQFLWDKCRRNI